LVAGRSAWPTAAVGANRSYSKLTCYGGSRGAGRTNKTSDAERRWEGKDRAGRVRADLVAQALRNRHHPGSRTTLALTVPDGAHIIETGMGVEEVKEIEEVEEQDRQESPGISGKTEKNNRGIDNQVNKRAGTTSHRNLSGKF